MREDQWGEICYYFAFILWMAVALIKYTYFKDMLPMSKISDIVMYIVLFLCFIKNILDSDWTINKTILFACFVLLVIFAVKHNKLQFAAMFALIYSGHNLNMNRILKLAFSMQLILFVGTVLASQTGILEDVIWTELTRSRHGLGFTHCMLASHFGLFLPILWFSAKRKMGLIDFTIIIIGNILLYKYTVGRTDFMLSILFSVTALLISHISLSTFRLPQFFRLLLALIPFIFTIGSIVITLLYQETNQFLNKVNNVLNFRLSLGKDAIHTYGFKLFGQGINFVGMSTLYYRPNATYDYVDNAYLNMTLIYGWFFITLFCLLSAVLIYQLSIKQDWVLLSCVGFFLAFGLLNPQSMYLSYNPLLLLLPATATAIKTESFQRIIKKTKTKTNTQQKILPTK